jgi:hypothetical protein
MADVSIGSARASMYPQLNDQIRDHIELSPARKANRLQSFEFVFAIGRYSPDPDAAGK